MSSSPLLEIATGNEQEKSPTRRAFIGAAAVAGVCYAAALGYPVYKYLASPAERAAK